MVDAQVDSIPSSPVEQKEIDKKDRAKRTSQFDRLAGSRVDIDDPLNRLHEVLGDEWSTYQTIGQLAQGESTTMYANYSSHRFPDWSIYSLGIRDVLAATHCWLPQLHSAT